MKPTVTIDGKPCVLKYGADERELIEENFKRDDGRPGSLPAMVREDLITSGSFKVQVVIVWAGLKHYGRNMSYDRVRAAMIEATQNEGVQATFLTPARDALFASGVLGRAVVQPTPEPEPDKVEGPKAPGTTAAAGESST